MRNHHLPRLAFLASFVAATPSLAQTPPAPAPSEPAEASPAPAKPAPAPKVYRPPVLAQTAPMRVQVISSTSFKDILSGQTFRLYGIDACASDQTASLGQQSWACGTVATAWLTLATLNKWIACTPVRSDPDAIVARCATSEYPDVAAEMLKTGYAVRLPDPPDRQISDYETIENAARAAYRGLWGSQFQMPWDYRERPFVDNDQSR